MKDDQKHHQFHVTPDLLETAAIFDNAISGYEICCVQYDQEAKCQMPCLYTSLYLFDNKVMVHFKIIAQGQKVNQHAC